jgi:hypothetical protein
MTSKVRVAICISGHFRSIASHIASFRKFILNNQNVQYDVFIHTWSVIDRNAIPLSVDFLLKEYNPVKYIIEPPMQFNITPLMNKMNFNFRDINGCLSMFYKIEQCNKLKHDFEIENNFTYDYAVRFRGDVELLEPLNIIDFDKNIVHIPSGGDYNGINDQLAFGNSKLMDLYSSSYSNIEKYLLENITFNPEFFTNETITRNNIPLNRFPLHYIIKWSNGHIWDNETRFQKKPGR